MSASQPAPDPGLDPVAARVRPRSRRHWSFRLLIAVGAALGVAWACGIAMRVDARLESPPGLVRGMLHGAMMPAAWPILLAGHDQEIYAARNAGRTYKLGYSLGVNLSGLAFFGILFVGLGDLRALHRKSPQ